MYDYLVNVQLQKGILYFEGLAYLKLIHSDINQLLIFEQLVLSDVFKPFWNYTILNPLKVCIKHDHKQDRQCAYNVTLRRVGVTTAAVEKQ
jgi:hypothetical protein